MSSTFRWSRFLKAQAAMAGAAVLGWFLLIGPCAMRSWEIKGGRVDYWKWEWLNKWYSNFEDGVSGQQALVWNSDGTNRVPYLPDSDARIRAYRWSALRNSCDNLKYVFADPDGLLITGELFGKIPYKYGYQEENGSKVPVISIG